MKKAIIFLVGICFWSGVLYAQIEDTLSLQPTDTTLKFACINTHWPTTANTTSTELDAFVWTYSGSLYVSHFYLQFNLSGLPSNAVIDAASLSLYADVNAVNSYAGSPTYGTKNAAGIYRVTSSWNGSTISWNTQPSYTTTDSAALPQSYIAQEDCINTDVTGIVNDIRAGNNYGFLIKMAQEATYYNAKIFYSPLSTVAGTQPKLVIKYHVPITAITGTVDTVYIGSSLQLSNATRGGVWLSSAPQVASIDAATGLVTANSVGATTITYATNLGYSTAVLHSGWQIHAVPVLTPGLTDYGTLQYRNFIRTYTPQAATTNSTNISLTNQLSEPCKITTNYFDGVGRPLQDVNYCSATSSSLVLDADLVKVHVYDNAGRETYRYLPYSVSDGTNRGKMKTNPATQIGQFYANNYPEDQPYNKTVFDNSPLDRHMEELAPGQNWVGNNRGTSYQYTAVHAAQDIPIWTVGTTNTSPPTFNGVYAEGALSITTASDEDGHVSYIFKDLQNRVVLKRSLVSIGVAVIDGFFILTYTYDETYYVYDDLSNLRWVITPEAVNQSTKSLPTSWTISQAILDGLCYRYYYDERGRLVEKKLPGKNVESMVYDREDRLVFTQDGNSQTGSTASLDYKLINSGTGSNIWKFKYYDVLGRELATGLYQPATSSWTRTNLQSAVNTAGYTNSTSSILYYVTNNQFNTYPSTMTDATVLTKKFYDDYSNSALSGKTFSTAYNSYLPLLSYTTLPQSVNQTRGLLTGTWVALMNPNSVAGLSTTSFTTANFYDSKERIIQSQSNNHIGGNNILTKEYNFGGAITGEEIHSTNTSAMLAGLSSQSAVQTTDIIKEHNFDSHSGLDYLDMQSINNSAFEVISSKNYDSLGRVKNKNVNVTDNHYTYNVRGWLTGINRNYFDNPSVGTFFREALYYGENVTGLSPISCYNGNIEASIWQHNGAGAPHQSYMYYYDALNRLTHAAYEELDYSNNNGVYTPTGGFNNTNTDYSMYGVSYDLNGNIESMNQMGPNTIPGETAPALIDAMSYKYMTNTNQLQGVSDNGVVTTNPDFKDDASNSQSDYTYDNNGSLKSDNNKGSTLEYSYLDKPEYINVTGKGTVNYVYDALGNKLRKAVYNSATATTTTTDYVGPFVYINNTPQYISHEEGRSLPIVNSGTLSYQNNYYIKDHLGNVRSVVQAIPESGPVFSSYLATHEVAQANVEGYIWSNLDNVRADKPGAIDSSDTKAAGLIGTDSTKRIGTSIMLSVVPGDQFSLSAISYYSSVTNHTLIPASSIFNTLAGALTGGTNSAGTPLSELPRSEAVLQTAFNNPNLLAGYDKLANTTPYDPTMPAAYLNYIVLDNNFNVIQDQSGAIQIGGESDEWNDISTPSNITVQQAGYVIAYLSSNDGNQVYFDNVQLTYYQGQEIEEDHYYPFGLTLQTASSETTPQINNIKYNGIELQHNEFTSSSGAISGLELYDAFYRCLDPQLGRWLQIDPEAEKMEEISPYASMKNTPIKLTDPKGNEPCCATAEQISQATNIYAENVVDAGGGAEDPATDVIAGGVEVVGQVAAGMTALYEMVTENPPMQSKVQKPATVALQEAIKKIIKGPKDLVGEAKAQKEKDAKAQERADKRAEATAKGNTKEGRSNQEVRGDHDKGASNNKRNQHEEANARRQREQAAADKKNDKTSTK